MNIMSLFGLQSQTEKIKEYRDLLTKKSQIDKGIDQLAEDYRIQKAQYDDLSNTNDEELQEKGLSRFNSFMKQQAKDIATFYKKKMSIEKSMKTLEKDEEIVDVLKEIKQLMGTRQLWMDGFIKKSVYINLLKAKNGGVVRYADVLLFDTEGRLLILQRAGEEGSATSQWCIPGGHVDPGESFKEAAIRELYEETGFDLSHEQGELREVAEYKNSDCEIHYFMAHLTDASHTTVVVDAFEEVGSEWIEPSSIDDFDFIFDMKDNLKRILGLECDSEKFVMMLKALQNGKISESVFKSFCDKNPDEIRKAKNKTYFSHKERKDLAEKGEAMPNGKYPIRNSQDLKDAIRLAGASDMPESEVKAWIRKRAKALGLESELPESWGDVEKSELEDDTEELEKSGRSLPIGTTRSYNGKEYEKTTQGWKPKKKGPKTVSQEDLDRAKEFGRKSKASAPYQDEEFMKFKNSLGKISDTQGVKLLNAYNDGKKERKSESTDKLPFAFRGKETKEKPDKVKELERKLGVEFKLYEKTGSLYGTYKGKEIRLSNHPSKFDERKEGRIDLDYEALTLNQLIHKIEGTDPFANSKKGDTVYHKMLGEMKFISSNPEKEYVEVETPEGRIVKYYSIMLSPNKDEFQKAEGVEDAQVLSRESLDEETKNVVRTVDGPGDEKNEKAEGFGLNIQFNDIEEAQMFKSLVEEWNNEGKINIQSVEEVPIEKSLNEEKHVFNQYLNFIEGAKTRLKNIHWGEKDNSKHIYLDDLSDEVSDFEDKIAEAGQSGFGRFKDGEVQGDEIEESDPIKICQMIFDRTVGFRKELEGKDYFNGEISWIDDFLASLKQSKYRLQMH